MVTYGRRVLTGRGQEGNFQGDGDVPCLDRDTCHMGVYIWWYSLNLCTRDPCISYINFTSKKEKNSKEQMKWKRQDIKLEVSDPKGVVYLLFGCKGLPSTGHHKLGSRWATNISMVITGEGTMNVWSQLSCLNYVPSMRGAETAPACGDGLGPAPAWSSFQLERGQYKEDWPQVTAS